jgi:peptidoglycan/xylan/chitin deacetylase (PgdA/CDA1 family)
VPGFSEQRAILEGWRDHRGRQRTGGAHAALTFDDGPDPDATPLVLDVLADLGIRATFFMCGEQAERHPELARRVADAGHTVGLHGHEHVREPPPGDFERGLAAVHEASGQWPALFRPPYGRTVAEMPLDTVLWSAWGLDWETVSPERIADLVCRDLEPGAIVLLHDSARYAPRESAEPTALALWAIAEEAERRGVSFGPL